MFFASEQAVIVDKEVYASVRAEFEAYQVYVVKAKELQKLEDAVMNEGKYAVNPAIVGHSTMEIAKLAGINVP